MSLTIGVDIGATKIAAGVVREDGLILDQARAPTPGRGPTSIVDAIAGLIEQLRTRHDVVAVGVGAAGLVDVDRNTVRYAPNVAWRDEPLGKQIHNRCGLHVVVENDANAAAWGEARFGAGRFEESVVMVTIGTGVGGGIIFNGELFRGDEGIAAELGHLLLSPDGPVCGCGNEGCWEAVGSGRALVRTAREFAETQPGSATILLRAVGGRCEDITGPAVTAAARLGDEASLRALHYIAGWTGRGLASLAAILDVGLFVLGGGVADAGELLRLPVEIELRRALVGAGHRREPRVLLAELGDAAGLVGAADLARRA